MDPFVLVRPNLAGGLALIDHLDREFGEIRAALWVREDVDRPWRLWIAPARRDVDRDAFIDAVIRITQAHDREMAGLMAHDVQLTSVDHPAMPDLRIVAPVEGTPPISLTNHLLGGFFLPEAVVLRMR
jgi:hypothetical protein